MTERKEALSAPVVTARDLSADGVARGSRSSLSRASRGSDSRRPQRSAANYLGAQTNHRGPEAARLDDEHIALKSVEDALGHVPNDSWSTARASFLRKTSAPISRCSRASSSSTIRIRPGGSTTQSGAWRTRDPQPPAQGQPWPGAHADHFMHCDGNDIRRDV